MDNRFLPKFSSTFAVVSPSGALQLMDASDPIQADMNYYQVAIDKTLASSIPKLSSFAVGSNGQMIAFGDSSGISRIITHLLTHRLLLTVLNEVVSWHRWLCFSPFMG